MNEKFIQLDVVVLADLDTVWDVWTTKDGISSFFAPDCKIDIQPGGAYEMYFDTEAPDGQKGGEGNVIMAVESKQMLSFTWNAPPTLPNVRSQRTHVVIRLKALGNKRTLVLLHHDGWGNSDEWEQAYQYFTRAWGKIVLPRLKYRLENGPIDWENPPDL